MNAPFYELGLFGENASLVVALGIGIAFGWFLERGGMGNARKLAAQFYLTDMTVFKMLFTAVVTAMLGVFWLTSIGFLEPSLIYVPPTWILPQLLGGLVFGAGFVMGGLCPGTSCVAISSGRTDGLALLGGMLFGILAFGEAFPLIEGLYDATPVGTLTIHELLGLPYPVVVLGVTAMAVGLFRVVEAVEAWHSTPDHVSVFTFSTATSRMAAENGLEPDDIAPEAGVLHGATGQNEKMKRGPEGGPEGGSLDA